MRFLWATYLKIFCRDYKTAFKIFEAVKQWLKERLKLDISPEKSKVTNLRKNYTEYLGFKLMVKPKKKKYVCQSRMSNKAVKITIEKFKKQIKQIKKHPVPNEVNKFNSMILGCHNYYKIATNVTKDFKIINFLVSRILDVRLRNSISETFKPTKTYQKLYGQYKGKIRTISNITIFPIYGCKTCPPIGFMQIICNYTSTGRKIIHDKLKGYNHLIRYLLKRSNSNNTTEFKDNSISLMVGQQGKCFVTGDALEIGEMKCHHKYPKYLGGTDKYSNLVWIKYDVHELIHATKKEIVNEYLNKLGLSENVLKKVNSLRLQVGNSKI